MSKHTPGPWHVEGVRGSAVDVASAAGICICVPLRAAGDCEANAHLIAAAPDLLEALQDLLKSAERANEIMLHEAGISVHDLTPMERARAAIAKATGEQT